MYPIKEYRDRILNGNLAKSRVLRKFTYYKLQVKNNVAMHSQKLKSIRYRICHCLSNSGVTSLKTMGMLLLAMIYGAMHQDVENWMYKSLSIPSDYVFRLFLNTEWLGWALFFCLIVWCVCYFKSLWKDRYISWCQFCTSFLGMEVSYLMLPHWNTIQLGCIRIAVFGLIFSISLLLLSVIKFFRNVAAKEADKPDEVGFISNITSVQKLDKVRKQYAIQLVDRLRITRNEEEAFAVAINGSWGTGKTTFLHTIKECLEKDEEYFLEFNVWNCRLPRQIIAEFFNALREKLKMHYSALAVPLLQYADLLSLAGAPKPVQTVFNKWFPPENINQLKTRIRNALKNLNKPVFVLIDDLDRLDTDEIFEVLRLIRNTANFPHLFFIVAFDREYVANQLKKKDVPSQYLDKIFMVDFVLPLLGDRFLLFKWMITDMKLQLDNILDRFTFGQQNLVLKALPTPRIAERFVRQLAQNMKFVTRDEEIRKEFSKKDLFWLELLKFTDYELFQNLYENPQKYLTPFKHNHLHLWVFSLPKDEQKLKENITVELSLDILKEIMPIPYQNIEKNSLAIIENFNKYFTLGLASQKISFSELYSLLLNGKSIDEQIDKWVREKKTASLYNQLMLREPRSMDLEVAKRFLNILVRISRYLLNKYIDELWGVQTCKDKFDADHKQLSSYLKDLLERTGPDVKDYIAVANIIHGMLHATKKDEKEMLLSLTELKELVKSNFNIYINNKQPDAADIFEEGHALHKIVKASVLAYPYGEDMPDFIEYESFLMDEVIRYFSVHKSNNQKAIEDFCRLNVSEDDPPELQQDEWERLDEKINSLT